MIVLNLKTYPQSLEKALYFIDTVSEVVEETGVRVIVCPPAIHLKDAAQRYSQIFAQHVDGNSAGAHTGTLPVEALKIVNAKGSLLNHSERKIPYEALKVTIERLHEQALESLACGETVDELKTIAGFSPNYVAIEPPELIGSGTSVSSAQPELVKKAVKTVKEVSDKLPVLCGAGITDGNDVKKAIELGSDGVLLASAFVKHDDPAAFLRSLCSVF
ncbi:MAG TPA: triose-phosphate isomerase [Candidatus Bilamarchaeaceae archaeon]|nr:triose-phosphate isomerase [Candidatus Bilamarchaeaceae archaeon]